jgi:hypothetical protein
MRGSLETSFEPAPDNSAQALVYVDIIGLIASANYIPEAEAEALRSHSG